MVSGASTRFYDLLNSENIASKTLAKSFDFACVKGRESHSCLCVDLFAPSFCSQSAVELHSAANSGYITIDVCQHVNPA